MSMLFAALAVAVTLVHLFVATPAVAEKSCTEGRYVITIQFGWTPDSDAAFPATAGTGFGSVVCASHLKHFTVWESGSPARKEVIDLAETGNVDGLMGLLSRAKSDGSVLAYAKYPSSTRLYLDGTADNSSSSSRSMSSTDPAAADIPSDAQIKPTAEALVSLAVNGSSGHTLISCISSIRPSPDFFVGLSNLQTCNSNNGKYNGSVTLLLRAYDAGSDDGEDYTSENVPAPANSAPHPIKSLIGFADNYGTIKLSLASGEGVTSASTSDSQGNDGSKSGCFPASELLHLASDIQDFYDIPGRPSMSNSQSLSRQIPMHAARVGDNLLVANDIEEQGCVRNRGRLLAYCHLPRFHLSYVLESLLTSAISAVGVAFKSCLSFAKFQARPSVRVSYRPSRSFAEFSLLRTSHERASDYSTTRGGNSISASQGQQNSSSLFFFSHADPHVVATFIELRTSTTSIRLSPGHYIYVFPDYVHRYPNAEQSCQYPQLFAADAVRPGDALLSPSNSPLPVTSVDYVQARGLFNPHSLNGDLVVSGVRVSCYTRAVSPAVAHFALMPIRAMYHGRAPYSFLNDITRLLGPSAIQRAFMRYFGSAIRGSTMYDQS